MKTCANCGGKWIRDDAIFCPQCHIVMFPIFGSRIGQTQLCPICFSEDISPNEDGSYTCECEHRFWINTDDFVRFPHNVIWPTREREEFYRMTSWLIQPSLRKIIIVFTRATIEQFPPENLGHHHMEWLGYWYLVTAIGPIDIWTGCWPGQPARCLHPGMFSQDQNDEVPIVATTYPGYTICPEALLSTMNMPPIFEIVGYKLNDTHDVMDIMIRLRRDLLSR